MADDRGRRTISSRPRESIYVGPLAYRSHKAMIFSACWWWSTFDHTVQFWRRVSEILAPTGGLVWSRGSKRFEVTGATSRPINMQAACSGDGGFLRVLA